MTLEELFSMDERANRRVLILSSREDCLSVVHCSEGRSMTSQSVARKCAAAIQTVSIAWDVTQGAET